MLNLRSGFLACLPVTFRYMELEFTKMHGLGNDFVILNGLDREIVLSPDQIRFIADRHFGIGCDQVLLIQRSDNPRMDIRYRIFNAAGDEVEHCGNGIRCVGDYLSRRGYVNGRIIQAETCNGNATIYLEDDGRIRVNMGMPRLAPVDIPITAATRLPQYELKLSTGVTPIMALSMGNPHAVLIVPDVDRAPVATLGPEIQSSAFFPRGVNVGFMQILDREHIRLRVYERGVGETLACGTGACAAMVCGRLANKLANTVDIGLKGGHLTVVWAGEEEPVWMTGPAATVYEGKIKL
ncbi:MAG: Diaminopimelate epimerase [Gammaproteobacteria bacterium]|nr:Diaminopimelate epimerase [Gammaproteobacteria bacterium]